MKKLLLSFLLLISLKGLAQYPLTQNLGSSSTKVQVPANGAMNALFINRTFVDTVAANLTNIKFYAGAQIYTTSDSVFWIRNLLASRWLPIGGGSSGGSTSITNIYNNSIVNITIYNDSCVIIHTGGGSGDTVCTQFDCGISGWEIINDSTIQICGFVCPDTVNIACDTFHFPPTPFFLFDNGLTQVSPGHVQLGGDLIKNTNIHTNYNTLLIQGRPVQEFPLRIDQYQSWGNGGGILSLSESGTTNTRMTWNYASSPWRTAGQGGFVPSPIQPYKGYYNVVNGYYGIGQPFGELYLYDNTAKLPYMIWHDKDTSNNIGLSFGVLSPPYNGTVATANMSDSIALQILYNGKIKFPNYIHNSDANTDSAFYRDNTGVMKYGKINTSASVPINTLLAATGTNTINNADYQQSWRWNSLVGIGLALQSFGDTKGEEFDNPQLLRIQQTGAIDSPNVTSAGMIVSMGRTGTNNTNIGISVNATGATNNYSIIAGEGNVGIGTSTPTMRLQLSFGRFGQAKGANVAAANDLTLGEDGNLFHVTGNTTINAITTNHWQAGSEIILIFDSNPTVKNNTAGGAGTAVMLLAGGVDFSATANDVLTLIYDGTSWFEVSRSVN